MIAVVGATGFTGRRVVAQLCKQHPNEEIVAAVRPEGRRDLLANQRVSFRTLEMVDVGSIRRALTGARLVVSVTSLELGYAPRLLAALEATKPDRVIFFSTMSVFSTVRTTTTHIGIEAERLIVASGLPATVFRPTMIYGRPGDRNVERLLRLLRRSPFVPVLGGGTALQQPVHVDDLATAVVRAFATNESVGRSYNLPGPRPMRYTEMIRNAGLAVGRRPIFIRVPLWLADPTVRAWSATGLWPRIRPDQLRRLMENKDANPDPAIRDFGYSAREFHDGIADEAALLGLIHTRIPPSQGGAQISGNSRS